MNLQASKMGYNTPKLTEYGHFFDLTAGGSGDRVETDRRCPGFIGANVSRQRC